MEQIKCSETSAFNNQTPGKYPKDYTQYILFVFVYVDICGLSCCAVCVGPV